MQQVRGKHLLILLAGTVALLLAIACGPSAQAPAQSAGVPAGKSEAPKGPVGKAVVALSPQTTGTVDSALSAGGSDFISVEPLYNRLTETSVGSLKPGPGIATEWSMSTDGLTWEFKIRKGVKFHNDDELTPEDVAFSINRVSTLSEARASTKAEYVYLVESVQAQGDKVVFRLKRPDWTFLSVISEAAYSVVPKKYLERVGDAGFLKAPVGTGPFKFVAWAKQEFLKLEAVDYEHFLWQPGVKQLEYRTVPEETTRLAMVRTGEADLAQVSVTSLKTLEGDSKLRAIKVPNVGGLQLFMFGQQDPQNPMSKLEVRKALSLAIDRQAIAEGIYRGYARPSATGIMNPAWEGWPQWGFDAPKQDLAKARELLAQAGYPGGKGLKFTLHNYEYGPLPLWTQVAPVLIEQWRQLGIEVESRLWEWGGYAPVAREGKFEPVAVSTHLSNTEGVFGKIL